MQPSAQGAILLMTSANKKPKSRKTLTTLVLKHCKTLHDISGSCMIFIVQKNTKSFLFGHKICLKSRLHTFSPFSAFKIHYSVSLWVKITKKPTTRQLASGVHLGASRQNRDSNSATGCDVINRWIMGKWSSPLDTHCGGVFILF